MSETSARLNLPYIQPSQAQKHVTHNEAIRQLDALVQMAAQSDSETSPPEKVSHSECYIIPENASGEWAGHETELAVYENQGWIYYVPKAGWVAYVQALNALKVFDGSKWRSIETGDNAKELTFSNGPSLTQARRFAVATSEALWTTDEKDTTSKGGHIQILNKSSRDADLGFVFQREYQTTALLGQFGSKHFRLTTASSPNTFRGALVIDPQTATVSQPFLPRFSAYTNYDHNIPVNLWITIGINNTRFNGQNCFDPTSNTIHIPSDGTYHLGATVSAKSKQKKDISLSLRLIDERKNTLDGSARKSRILKNEMTGELTLNSLFELKAGSKIALQVHSTSSPCLIFKSNTDFWGYKVG